MSRNDFINSQDQTSAYFYKKIFEHIDETMPNAKEDAKILYAKHMFERMFSMVLRDKSYVPEKNGKMLNNNK